VIFNRDSQSLGVGGRQVNVSYLALAGVVGGVTCLSVVVRGRGLRSSS
jgi:hypothetical protein